ncbi:MAG: diacylglycerol kinase family lipid kinase, partial [Prevotella sp.]|nr:diacylglycerol kinase family lipid kinase [Prevotella sp.]
RRKKPGVIHYDGDPMMSGEEVHIQLEEKGIRVVVNPDADKAVRKPNALQTAAAELFNEINFVRDDLSHRQRQVRALSKVLQRKLNL